MKYKVSDLEGALLDAAVAKAEGYKLDSDGDNETIRENGGAPSRWKPSIDWKQGGPIIERERIDLSFSEGHYQGVHGCMAWPEHMRGTPSHAFGSTPLIAAMRAYVTSKLGDVVEL